MSMADPFRFRERVRKTPPAGVAGVGIDREGMGQLWSVRPILPPSGIRINDNRKPKGREEKRMAGRDKDMLYRKKGIVKCQRMENLMN